MSPTLTVNAKANRGVEQVEKSLFLALKRNGKVYIVVKNGLSTQPVKQENYLKTAGRCGNLESARKKLLTLSMAIHVGNCMRHSL